jgi:hypothetical protein
MRSTQDYLLHMIELDRAEDEPALGCPLVEEL